jgi:anti-sigma factor RsiW
MKPTTPHDPLDDLIAAALHGDLTPEERAQFESRLSADPAAQAAYQEAQAMHDLLDQTHRAAQPDPDFEQRTVSAVRRKLTHAPHRETAWESLVALWIGLREFFSRKRTPIPHFGAAFVIILTILIAYGVALGPITNGIQKAKQSAALQADAKQVADYQAQVDAGVPNPVMKSVKALPDGTIVAYTDADDERRVDVAGKTASSAPQQAASPAAATSPPTPVAAPSPIEGLMKHSGPLMPGAASSDTFRSVLERRSIGKRLFVDADKSTKSLSVYDEPMVVTSPQGGTIRGSGFVPPKATQPAPSDVESAPLAPDGIAQLNQQLANGKPQLPVTGLQAKATANSANPPASEDSRKLIRNAQLDLEVKSFQAAFDQVSALTKAAGGYVDTSNSQKGGNGKLQGTIVVKVLPENLDGFLLKLRDLGEVKNQSVSTDDVTKEYFDTQARLVNSQKMEVQLQDLLKRENSKVADLLAVERELGRVRGEIEQMQGQLKLYDFQVQYATVTMQIAEKDLRKAAAYLLKEQDNFSLFATDVEGTFQKARAAADSFKAQVLTANLQHNSGSDVSAELDVMVAPDQIEPFLAQVRGLGRVANFTRQTQRIAQDGGDSAQPADQTLTEKDKVSVQLAIRSDDDSRKQVALTVVAKAVDEALDQAKAAALANAGAEILNSSLNKTPQGQSTAAMSVRVPGKEYDALLEAFRALGRPESLSIQRNDSSGAGGDDAPVIIQLSLTDDDQPVQATNLSIVADDVDAGAQQIKQDAATAGVEVKASSFARQPDGTELAQMTLRLPMGKYPAFLETLKRAGKVESLSVQRDDCPDQTRLDDTAPAEITLQLHNQRALVADDNGLFATLRQTFGDGAGALFGSVRVIGVLLAFLAPWVVTLLLIAWIARRIYVWRKK